MLEILLDPLGALVITFFVMSIVSIGGMVLLYLSKNEKLKKGVFYFLAAWSMVVMYCGILMSDGFYFANGPIALVLGALGIAGVLIQLFSKKENKFKLAEILVMISVAAGMINCFFI
ncbi:MAG: hypothetical protein E7260_10255 [Lachnospiraceae bacterium]|nr:hypothetical protein [Lachnospiraceae bacterium]